MNFVKHIGWALVLLPCFLHGQGSSASLSQMKIPMSARVAALGNVTIADAGELASWSLNPANLYASDARALALTHVQWIQEVQTEYLAIRFPLIHGSAGLAIATNAVPGIEIRERPGQALGTFTARFASFDAGYATPITGDLSIGVTTKYFFEKLYTDDATGFGFDAGLLYTTPIAGLQIGASITNLGTLGEFRGERSDLPTFLRAGVSYGLTLDDFHLRATAASASGLRESENHVGGSLEGSYRDFVAIRCGYQSGYDSRGFSTGMGFSFEFMTLDYAYIPFTYGLGGAHLLSLGFQF